jgi:hypothetical protein
MRVNTYYLGLIEKMNDGIWKQAIPDVEEHAHYMDLTEDPLDEEGDIPLGGPRTIIHRYPDRVLLFVSTAHGEGQGLRGLRERSHRKDRRKTDAAQSKPEMRASCKCCGLDLNQHTLSGTSPSSWRVYQIPPPQREWRTIAIHP